ncbi:Cytoplasmic tRNA 2-thiolation protein [Sparassis crispa]|uniref:Cytoplasmic tRNA 2-thiolation protein n=1 Tax=Sparassis crispa TaxID=139825 RepID=A0A401H1X7_9APHY|nr:Cytoplasmic tRNA 2-thiolation protein [Sparassis crispa]GBE88399.1 Cytoplasmic tRNA 2-thiolation protein [Sparassis crispa]
MKDRTTQIADTIAGYPGVECRTLRVQDAFDRNWWMKVHATPDSSDVGVDLSTGELILSILSNSSTSSSPLGLLHSYLASLPTATAVSSAVQALIRLLLLHTAVETSSSHLVLGTSLTSLAVSLISGVAQGRGFSVREEVQEDWFPEEVPGMPDTGDNLHRGTESPNSGKMKGNGRLSVRVMRPLRDVGMKECAAWAWWKKLRVVGKERWQWSGAKQGIYALTKDFIVGLEKDYPSTVSTVVRTCGKLAPKGRVIGRCVLCERPVQEGWQEWKSSISVQFRLSSNVEIDPIPFLHPSVDCVPPRLSTAPTLTPHLCYACHTTFTSKSSRATPPPLYPSVTKTPLTPLPTWVGSHLLERQEQISTSRMAREEMRSAVSDFLLE